MRLPRRAPIPPINLQKSPKTPRVQICRVVIKEQFSEAFDGVHYRKLFAAPATEAADRILPALPERLSNAATKPLEGLGVGSQGFQDAEAGDVPTRAVEPRDDAT